MPLVYKELHRLAHRYMRGERPDHTLQTTALVNEAHLRLIDSSKVRWQNRAHFLTISAQAMRRVLVDMARSRFLRSASFRDEAWKTRQPMGADWSLRSSAQIYLLMRYAPRR
jgi:RNA polymerase sigma factor (TIGR02999 family)